VATAHGSEGKIIHSGQQGRDPPSLKKKTTKNWESLTKQRVVEGFVFRWYTVCNGLLLW